MFRMPFGDHLEELRNRLILALIGVALGTSAALIFAKHIQAILLRPLALVQRKFGEPLGVMALAPADYFMNWLMIGIMSGMILSMPWVLYQIWLFVAAGLYRTERRWVIRFAPLSVGLFALGVLFLYFVVLPLVLNFFVSFNRTFTPSGGPPSSWERLLLGMEPVPLPPESDTTVLGSIPLLQSDPVAPPSGSAWINVPERRYTVQTDQGRMSMPMTDLSQGGLVRNTFALRQYMTFVLQLMLAFGVAFELPIIVVFLSLSGIFSCSDMARSRRYIIFGIVVAAAILTPSPDFLSQILLALPMVGLFEGGLYMAKVIERRTRSNTAR